LPPSELVTPEFASQLADLSRDVGRVLAVVVDRRGRVESVSVGDAKRTWLPDLGRARAGGRRFRGVRVIRTRLSGEGLSQDDLADLSKLRLDAVVAIGVAHDGLPLDVTWAHLNPAGGDDPWTIAEVSHASRLDVDFSSLIDELEAEFEATKETTREVTRDRAMIVYVRTRDDYNHVANLAELHELCASAGVEVAEAYVQSRVSLDPKFAVGKGALEEIELRALKQDANILIFGQELNPAQVRSINDATKVKVIDRTQLILDIFAQRAQSSVGKLQVELAQLKYMQTRLVGRGAAMSRLAGGIGGRGPGETRLEVDRRRIRDRIRHLEEGIDRLSQQRELRRKTRREGRVPVIAIVGYTNAGKSTLLNTLTGSTVLSENKLFATLDPTSRRIRFPRDREVILTDTVGFIRDLPAELRQAFRATLEELAEADLLLHVIDASDPGFEEQMKSTERILHEMELDEAPRLRVFNKIDLVEPAALIDIRMAFEGIFVSALDKTSTRELIDAIDRRLLEMGRGDVVAETEEVFAPEDYGVVTHAGAVAGGDSAEITEA
jgi:GTP-binding protein HflX